MDKRIDLVRQHLVRVGAVAMLVTDPVNITYLTGQGGLSMAERGALLVVSADKCYLLVSPLLAIKEQAGITILPMQKKGALLKCLQQVIGVSGRAKLCIEKADLRLHEFERIKSLIRAEYVDAGEFLALAREIKDRSELRHITQACQITARAWRKVPRLLQVGLSERQLSWEIVRLLIDEGAQGVPAGFDPIVAYGEHSAIPHHLSSKRKLKRQEVVLVDFGCVVQGYVSDMTRTICFGSVTPEFDQVEKIVRRAYLAAVDKVRAGVSVAQADAAARAVIVRAGYGEQYIHTTGHGIGLGIHEEPHIYHDTAAQVIFQSGMVVTIEPGIYLPGEFGYRYENSLLVTATGTKLLTR